MMWFIFCLMLLAALIAVALPIYRANGGPNAALIVSTLVVVLVSSSIYVAIGRPEARSGVERQFTVEEMIASLEARLLETPDDLRGWHMLGRSQMQLGNYARAVDAYEQAMQLEGSADGETMISLGEALLSADRESISGRAGQLIESGLALAPNSQRGLFYGGFSALQRQDPLLAADRWEALLALSPPPEIRPILEKRVREWRGEPVADAVDEHAAVRAIEIDVSLSAEAAAATAGTDTVFVIARDPTAPSPPVAVARTARQELPGLVRLTDANAMIAGRVPSAFAELEFIVRISRSGQPIPAAGDWYGSIVAPTSGDKPLLITIDRPVE